jgi:hypothetical protein
MFNFDMTSASPVRNEKQVAPLQIPSFKPSEKNSGNFIPTLDDNEISIIQQDQVDVSAIADQSFTINQMLSKM